MIGPLPHTGPMPPEGRGDSADQQHGQAPSDLFAQLLGAGGALADGAAVPGEMPSLAAPEVSLLAPDASGAGPAQQALAPRARMFNQNGFFGHAGETPGQAVALGQGDAMRAPVPGAVPEDLAAGLDREIVSGGRQGPGAAARPGASPRPAMRAAGAVPAVIPAEPMGRAMAAPPPAIEEYGAAADPVASAQRRAHRAPSAARSALHVALRELESGLQIAARVEGLDEAERHRLRDEIAALLGRHGLSAARIQINAMPLRESER
ncbi:MAG: hypothetical protein IIZ38_00085 [Sphingomonas sp.]|uniref:hypothetical protein n=2 Tax=Alphaproteobacteria TaxID=28211 RepID=UPI0025D9FA6A|nr:hypothetical protein [Sphingomonas sp.]MBQ1496687.1 hypothetical protein [Sphingomonas sp.]